MELKIDKELRGLIPAITEDEKGRLEKSLKEEGCRDPLVVWEETILDGHNRFEICQKHDIPFKTIMKGFDNREQAKLWIICNQLARRNVTKEQKYFLVGMQYKIEKKTKQEAGAMKGKRKDQNDLSLSTAKNVGEQHGMSEASVKRAEKFAEKVDKLPEKKKAAVLAGKEKLIQKEPAKKTQGKIGIDSDNLMKIMVLYRKLKPAEKAKFLLWIKQEGENQK